MSSPDPSNPYAPPQQPLQKPPVIGPDPAMIQGGEFAPCPRCQQCDAVKVSFTWWGGIVGPAMFSHVKCRACGRTFNGKTGKPNDTAIAIYVGVGVVLGLGIVVALALGGML
jgi:hypothetical protein